MAKGFFFSDESTESHAYFQHNRLQARLVAKQPALADTLARLVETPP